MTRLLLLLRNLLYFRGVNLAVIAGTAVATAVLTGALMVGDSVRGSLADLAVRRLGPVDFALFSAGFFPQSLADDLGSNVVPGIIIRGGAVNTSATSDEKPTTADVQIAALGKSDAGSSGFDLPGLPVQRDQCLINGELSRALLAPAQTQITLSLPVRSDVPRESALAKRGRNDVQNQLPATIAQVDDRGDFLSLFSPAASQRVPRNAWANLIDLQDLMEQRGKINTLLARASGAKADDELKQLNDRVAAAAHDVKRGPGLYGLSLRPAGNDEASVFSDQTYLSPPVVDAAQRAALALHIRLREVSVNLLGSITAEPSRPATTEPGTTGASSALVRAKVTRYAVAAGITSLDQGTLAGDEAAINQWTADQLGIGVGDKVLIDFYTRPGGGDLIDASQDAAYPPPRRTFTVKYILPMSGLGADPQLPPVFRGLTDAKSVSAWNPPAELADKINKKLADEKYWDKYRAAPKIYLNFDTARALWGGAYGDVTGLRVPAVDGDRFLAELLQQLKPESIGLVFHPIKAEQLAAAGGGTDFSMFFLMFSVFLIVAAALLVAMLFRLNVEGRARQLGLMSALGFSPGSLRRMALWEGVMLAGIGGIIGLAGAIGYTWLILLGLRTWWVGAVGTTAMTLHIQPLTLVYGFIGSLLVALAAIAWAVWRVGQQQAARLLAGATGNENATPRSARWGQIAAIVAAIAALAIVGAALAGAIAPEPGFGGGALLLCAALGWVAATLRPRRHGGAAFVGFASLAKLGAQNASRHPARAVLAIGLVAFAAFTLITVAALKQNGVRNPDDRHGPTGGYRLILDAGIPLTGDLNTPVGRRLLGMDPPDDPIYADARFTPLRRWAGQDISCLNLTRPNSPTILGLPPAMLARNAFEPAGVLEKNPNFWTLLQSDQGDQIPVIADSDTLEYVLQIGIGDTISITDQLGVPRKLKLVASVSRSIFQGQLLMSQANFRQLFPAQGGFGVVLIDFPGIAPDRADDLQTKLARRLSTELNAFSVSVDTTAARLQTYQDVQNTYLETFQTLGALGLMLGTLGLAVVLVRTVIERRAELALLASLGFRSASRVMLTLYENAILLIMGLALGAICAIVGILPAVVREARPINAAGLALTLAAVLLLGLFASVIAVWLSGVHVKPSDLRHE